MLYHIKVLMLSIEPLYSIPRHFDKIICSLSQLESFHMWYIKEQWYFFTLPYFKLFYTYGTNDIKQYLSYIKIISHILHTYWRLGWVIVPFMCLHALLFTFIACKGAHFNLNTEIWFRVKKLSGKRSGKFSTQPHAKEIRTAIILVELLVAIKLLIGYAYV